MIFTVTSFKHLRSELLFFFMLQCCGGKKSFQRCFATFRIMWSFPRIFFLLFRSTFISVKSWVKCQLAKGGKISCSGEKFHVIKLDFTVIWVCFLFHFLQCICIGIHMEMHWNVSFVFRKNTWRRKKILFVNKIAKYFGY